jgi:4-amino-4-deoxy-L-arabinose transferase-like glycosyltransferase
LRYLGLALLVIASQRELSLGKLRPDALLQSLLLLGFAALLTYLATDRLVYTALMGLAFGLGFLTKSFAFPITLLSVALLAAFALLWQRRKPARIATAVVIALACFAIVAGPYIAALSKQKGRLDFGDSGNLNYAWYIGGTEKMHLQNGTPAIYGTSEVHLLHPEKVLLNSPLVTSYREFPYGTYPPWFDATYFNDRIKTHINPSGQIHAILRNAVLTVRYLLNHPEGWLLLLVLLLLGARPDLCRRLAGNGFWIIPLLLGIAIFAIYGLVNVEERYVTVGYLAVVLTLFASLRTPSSSEAVPGAISTSSALILLLALLAVGESTRKVAETRRILSVSHISSGWYKPEIFKAAEAINKLGVGPGDAIACAGTNACLYDIYWARLAGVRILSEIYLPEPYPFASLASVPNLSTAIETARRNGARIIVGYFDPVVMKGTDPATAGWVSLGDTDFYALPLNPPASSSQTAPAVLP